MLSGIYSQNTPMVEFYSLLIQFPSAHVTHMLFTFAAFLAFLSLPLFLFLDGISFIAMIILTLYNYIIMQDRTSSLCNSKIKIARGLDGISQICNSMIQARGSITLYAASLIISPLTK